MTVKVAQFTLCYGRMPFIRCYPRETREMVFDAHDRAFAAFGGSCGIGIYDNMSTAVERVLIGKDRRINPRFAKMCGHHLVDPTFRDPGAAHEKGRVESRIMTMRERLFRPRLEGETLDCLNRQMAERCRRHAREHPHPDFPEWSIHEVFAGEEQRCLVPGTEPAHSHASRQTTASKTCLVRFDNNSYSVEARAAGKPVELRALADHACLRLGGEIVGSHVREFGRGQAVQSHPHHPHTGAQARCGPQRCPVPGQASAGTAGSRARAPGWLQG